MKHSALFLTTLLLTLFCYSQPNDDIAFLTNSYDRKAIKENNIDTICVTIDFPGGKTERFYVFDKLGNLAFIRTFDNTGTKTSESIFTYNDRAQLISRHDKAEALDDHISYFYNRDGQLEKAVTKNKADETITDGYYYDGQKLIKQTRKENAGAVVTNYKYDKQDRLIELTTTIPAVNDTEGQAFYHKTISYNANGTRASEDITSFGAGTIIYNYDKNNRVILVQKETDIEKYSYNDKGFLLQKEVNKSPQSGPPLYTEKYRYATRLTDVTPEQSRRDNIPAWVKQMYEVKNSEFPNDAVAVVIFYEELSDSASYCIYEAGDKACKIAFVATQKNKKNFKQFKIENSCDLDPADPEFIFTIYEHDPETRTFTVLTDVEKPKSKYVTKRNGRVVFKSGYSWDNSETTTSSAVIHVSIDPSGNITTKKGKAGFDR